MSRIRMEISSFKTDLEILIGIYVEYISGKILGNFYAGFSLHQSREIAWIVQRNILFRRVTNLEEFACLFERCDQFREGLDPWPLHRRSRDSECRLLSLERFQRPSPVPAFRSYSTFFHIIRCIHTKSRINETRNPVGVRRLTDTIVRSIFSIHGPVL